MADLYAKYNCTYCQEEISGVRVKCAECPDFDICLQCFSVGAEIGQHKNDHSYQFVDSGAFGIFLGRSSWSANEERQKMNTSQDTWMAASAGLPGAMWRGPRGPLYTVQTETKARSAPVPWRDCHTLRNMTMKPNS
ncbi:Transcriptional adapter 2B [Operophtera brumata]|uniref:Transcriptional adapter 2B n=1 Tax=Operophtera brumata TaxID=104452 RepID=A0A0L7KMC0_OPEBR|nr:Transcriptional adapter 2B [Operophtera brumata]